MVQRRSAKTKTTTKIQYVPQGAIGTYALPLQDDATPEYPPLLQEVRNNMLKFSHCILLTRVGGFYEVIPRLQIRFSRLLIVPAIL